VTAACCCCPPLLLLSLIVSDQGRHPVNTLSRPVSAVRHRCPPPLSATAAANVLPPMCLATNVAVPLLLLLTMASIHLLLPSLDVHSVLYSGS